jgi:hypothetical protein
MIPGNVPDRRFQVALGLSILMHVLLAGGWGDGIGGVAVPQAPLQARLEGAPAMPADVVPLPETPTAATPDLRPPEGRRPTRMPVTGTSATSSGAGTESRFYLARELDQYPAAPGLAELRQVAAVVPVRVWVGIDQQGRVVDVAAADPGYPVAGIRERLLAVRFVPALKDGRPVKSRVLMEWPEG